MEYPLTPPKRIFVTGAAGFIGTVLTQKLLARGCEVVGMSRRKTLTLPPGYSGTVDQLWEHPNFTWKQGDILNVDDLLAGMEGCDAVFHLAGYAKNYSKDKSVFTKINVDGMRNVFTAAKKLAIPKIVWTSSIVTFGMTPRGAIYDESTPRYTPKCWTEYEETKTIAEKEALQWAAEGLPVVMVNPARVYGPGQMSEGNALARLIDDYMRGRMPFLPNFGKNIGNYVLVDDVAEGQILAMEHGRIGERYILGGENVSLREFFKLVDKVTGKRHIKFGITKFEPLVFSYVQLLLAKTLGIYPRITPGWIRTFVVDWTYSIEKAKRELGYNPVSLEEGLRRTCAWLEEMRRSKKNRK